MTTTIKTRLPKITNKQLSSHAKVVFGSNVTIRERRISRGCNRFHVITIVDNVRLVCTVKRRLLSEARLEAYKHLAARMCARCALV